MKAGQSSREIPSSWRRPCAASRRGWPGAPWRMPILPRRTCSSSIPFPQKASLPSSAPIPRWKRGYDGWRTWHIEDNFRPVRSLCLRIIKEVEEGRRLDETIDRHFSSPGVPVPYKPLIHEIASVVIRWKLSLDWLLSHFVREGLK